MSIVQDDVNRLAEIKAQIADLLNEFKDITRQNDSGGIFNRAKAYCFAEIECAISRIHPTQNCTLEDVIAHFALEVENDELEPFDDDDEWD